MDPAKVEAVLSWERPKNVSKVHNFLSLIDYYRRFMQGFSSVVAPLSWLKRKGVSFLWSEECETNFLELRFWLTLAPMLTLSSGIEGFMVYTDAFSIGLRAILM